MNDNGITAPGSGAGSDCLYNIDSVELYGIELEASFNPFDKFKATAAYVYQEHKATHTGYEEDWTYYLPATLPKHKVKMTAGYEVIQDGWIQLSGRWVGSRGTQQSGELSDYAICDLGFKKKFKWDSQNYELNLFINNATGTRYEEVAGYPMPRYVWGMSLAVEF